ncbi:MAG: hypothetical protein IBX43_00935 [Campylobacterales bacterium]|nr:hypothetical protein [Campylobacterales bacterium]
MKRRYGLLFVVFIVNADAQNLLVSLLKSIENNHTLHMHYRQQAFVCTPYGIETVSELLLRTDLNSSCQQHIRDFRASNPQEKFFAAKTLHIEQQYSVEAIETLCFLHLSSGHSYSEALLEKGYARISPQLQDTEFMYRFEKAELRAKIKKEGIWSDEKIRGCF